ncbi:MAG: YbdD/YjiX family protein [Methyloglobulus sp.]|nr:YbdD/YjiX family protein [Methyloglobulus sp.]
MVLRLKRVWRAVRQLSGDDAYERYLRHYANHHQGNKEPPLTKAEFFKRWQDGLWDGVKRCC